MRARERGRRNAASKFFIVPDEECYRESWKYFIFLMICKMIPRATERVSKDASAQTALRDISAFVYDSYGSIDPNLTTIFTPGQKIKISGKLNFWGVGGEVKTIDVKDLPTFYSEINRNMMECILRCIPDKNNFYICFDELDLGFDPKKKDYLLRLIGLIRAAKYVNERFANEKVPAGVIVLLREDIWNTLKFEDKNKVAQNLVSTIQWSQEEGSHCLKRLMEKRFQEALGAERPVSWESIFDESKTMAQFQTKYDFICRRTFLRPRDMIQFCNEVLAAFKAEPTAGGFETEHVKSAEKKYSNYFMLELEDELHKHSASYEQYFEVLKRLLNVVFSRDEFETAWNENKTMFDESSETPAQALRALYEFSIIGFLATGGQGAGSKYIWRYEDPRTLFDPNARNFKVHLGLKEQFELKLYARKKGKYA